jgi:FtsP/CotA-like multicopper oxidase with cupredoxin domain
MPGICGKIGVRGGVRPHAHLFCRYFLLEPEQLRPLYNFWLFIYTKNLYQALPDHLSTRTYMRKSTSSSKVSRRDFLKAGSGLIAAAAVARFNPKYFGQSGEVTLTTGLQQTANPTPDIHLAISDGWIPLLGKMPILGSLKTLPKHYPSPNTFAPDFDPNNLRAGPMAYVLGFRDVTGMSEAIMQAQKTKIQSAAPIFWVNQGTDYQLALSNPGLQMQPDLVSSHSVQWHGFRNVYPFLDDEPHSPLTILVGQTLTLDYKPHDPGTYMYHCYFEATEDVHLGMAGAVFVRPIQDGNISLYPSGKYAYNDGDGATGFDREFALTLTNAWAQAHWDNNQIRFPGWIDCKPEYLLLNGRVYPDTLVGNGGEDVGQIWGYDAKTGDLLPPPNRPSLRRQPISSLIEAQSGERILLRFANLTIQKHIMTTAGLRMRVIGRNATLFRDRDGTELAYETNTVSIGAGESCDTIITAPTVANETRFLLYNQNNNRLQNTDGMGYGGQMTEIRVHPAGTLAPQTMPNTNPHVD